MSEVTSITSLVKEQTQCKDKVVVLLHSPEIFDALKDRKQARPVIITSEGITDRMKIFYTSQQINFNKWDKKRAMYVLEDLRKTFPKYNGVTPERFYQIGRYLTGKDTPIKTEAFAGLLLNNGPEIFDCYMKMTCSPAKANLLSNLANSMQSLSDNELWLRVTAPAAYAATRIPGLQLLNTSGQSMAIRPDLILEAAKQRKIDYEHFQTIS
ncbi:MAG: hypothetical protein NTW67_05080 [Candidatus Woesearchaeota archaeon]|nr:hypothetical protein [Candidatus Woesearchaeota archaeon]